MCCKWRELFQENRDLGKLEAVNRCGDGWFRTAKLNSEAEVLEWDCQECSLYYLELQQEINTIFPNGDLEEELKKLGCCETFYLVLGVDEKVNNFRLEKWLGIFLNEMCRSCLKRAKLAIKEVMGK